MNRSRTAPGELDTLQTQFEKLAGAIKPVELGNEQRERLLWRVLKRAYDHAPEGTTTIRAGDGRWVEIAACVEIRVLRIDEVGGTHTTLMRMRPGGVIPAHRHAKEEEFVVLEGECHIGSHLLRAGDAHIAAAGSWHEPVTTQTGVLVLLRGEYPHPRAEHSAVP